MKTTMRSFKMTRLFQLGMESFESSSVFYLTVKVLFYPRQRPSRSSIRLLCFASWASMRFCSWFFLHPLDRSCGSIQSIAFPSCSTPWCIKRQETRPAETSLCTCCYAIRWTSLRQIADSALRSTQRAPVPGIPVLGHGGQQGCNEHVAPETSQFDRLFCFFLEKRTGLKGQYSFTVVFQQMKIPWIPLFSGKDVWNTDPFLKQDFISTQNRYSWPAQFSQPKGESSTGAVPRQNAWFKKPGGFWQHP